MKSLVLQDLPDLYPGLTRAGIERVVRTFEEPPLGGGGGMASQLAVIAPAIAARVANLAGAELSAYTDLMKGAAVLTLQMWTPKGAPPPVSAIVAAVEALHDRP